MIDAPHCPWRSGAIGLCFDIGHPMQAVDSGEGGLSKGKGRGGSVRRAKSVDSSEWLRVKDSVAFSLEYQSVLAKALKLKPKHTDLRLRAAAADCVLVEVNETQGDDVGEVKVQSKAKSGTLER